MEGVWLNQTDAATALGISVNAFISSKKKVLKDNGLTGHKKKYWITLDSMKFDQRQKHKVHAGLAEVDPVLQDIIDTVDFTGEREELDIQEARKRKIIKETEYLDQKIIAKKEQLFSEWSQKFFIIFSKSFAKFKNSLIDLHLSDAQVDKLHQNLEFAIKNMEMSLSDIKQDYINDIDSDEQ